MNKEESKNEFHVNLEITKAYIEGNGEAVDCILFSHNELATNKAMIFSVLDKYNRDAKSKINDLKEEI